jgi:hypothetical protein
LIEGADAKARKAATFTRMEFGYALEGSEAALITMLPGSATRKQALKRATTRTRGRAWGMETGEGGK